MLNDVNIKNLNVQKTSTQPMDDADKLVINAEHDVEFESLIAEQQTNLLRFDNQFNPNSATANNPILVLEQEKPQTSRTTTQANNGGQGPTNISLTLNEPLAHQSKMLALAMTNSLSNETALSNDSKQTNTTALSNDSKQANTTALSIESITNKSGQTSSENISAAATQAGLLHSSITADVRENALPFLRAAQSTKQDAETPKNQLTKSLPRNRATNIKIDSINTSSEIDNFQPKVGLTAKQVTALANRLALGQGFQLDRGMQDNSTYEIKPVLMRPGVIELASPASWSMMQDMVTDKPGENISTGLAISLKINGTTVNYLDNTQHLTRQPISNQHTTQLLNLAANSQFSEVKIKDSNLGELHFSVSGSKAEQLGVFAVQQQSQTLMHQHFAELKAELAADGLAELEIFSSQEQQQKNKQQYLAQHAQNYADIEEALILEDEDQNGTASQQLTAATSSLNIRV